MATTAQPKGGGPRGSGGGTDADVIVVGAGPGGSSAAFHLARAGLDVLLLEKAAFPREKVCGDGLTPRAVASLVEMGIDTGAAAGWVRNRGLRIIGGRVRLELPWPELASWPDYGLVRPRLDFDELLARNAEKAGARLHELTTVTGPVRDERTGRVTGVTALVGPGLRSEHRRERQRPRSAAEEAAGKHSGSGREPVAFRAPLVVAADGNSARLALALGIGRREDRPMGVAVRRYFRSARTHDDYLESHLELWDGPRGTSRLLPGYGWVFGMGDGTSNVGLGLLNTATAFQNTDYRELLRRWLSSMPPEEGFVEDNATGPVRGGALPMGFNRTPHYCAGMLLVGDAGGAVNPFNGEGIAYAMESGRVAAEVIVQALARGGGPARERALSAYPSAMRSRYGGYYTLGRLFVHLIGHPAVMRLGTRHALPQPTLMRFTLKLLANLTDPRGGDASDRLINALTRLTPTA